MRRGHESTHERSCRISYWQGYVTGRYYAYDDDTSSALLCSRPFRTWTWRRGNIAPDRNDAASAALETLVRELEARGWVVADSDASARAPEAITRDTVLSALRRIGGDEGATAAEVGLEVLGEHACVVRHVPLRVGAELRRLQLAGKVERCENGGPAKWFLTGPQQGLERRLPDPELARKHS